MLDECVIACYSTSNYEPVTKLFLKSITDLNTNTQVKHKYVEVSESEVKEKSFKSNLWYESIKNKLLHNIDVLKECSRDPSKIKYVILSDCDIIFVEKNKSKWSSLKSFIDESNKDIFFLEENSTKSINGGFYIVKNNKNIGKIIDFFIDVCSRDFRHLHLADQTLINQMLEPSRINFDFIPNKYVIWATRIYDTEHSLIHHAVRTTTIEDKIKQITQIKECFL